MEHITDPLESDLVEAGRKGRGRPASRGSDGPSKSAQAAAGAAGRGAAGALASSDVLTLQRHVGNAAVTTMVQRRSSEEFEEESPVLKVIGRGGGKPLPQELREEMEQRLGADFSEVRVHHDSEAAESAAAVNAAAYTSGSEIVLGSEAAPISTEAGKKTLAHELTHVVQQRNGQVDATPTGDGIAVSHPSDRFEQAAVANADAVMSAPAPAPVQRATVMDVSSNEEEEEEVAEQYLQSEENLQEAEAEETDAGDWTVPDSSSATVTTTPDTSSTPVTATTETEESDVATEEEPDQTVSDVPADISTEEQEAEES
jgi:hypothetical protein